MSSFWKSTWIRGNNVRLLENGEEFFPAVFGAIRDARTEVLIETFIWFEDKVGNELQRLLIDAARRGVRVDVLVDGFGSSELSEAFIAELAAAGVRLRMFDPVTRIFRVRLNVLRRMHRKIVVVDGERAFVGGINYSADHLADFGPQAKQDYAVEVRGPVVQTIHRFVAVAGASSWWRRAWDSQRRERDGAAWPAAGGQVDAMFVTRDNHRHRTDIERHYRIAIRSARRRVLIANAYFFPGYRLLREMRRAARRGVDVRLILQGEPDMPIVKTAASLLYRSLHDDGVRIHEYCKRPLHGKVAVVDDDWATVGSSNLDPLSLALNLEANLVLRGREFVADLTASLDRLIDQDCTEVDPEPVRFELWQRLRSTLVFHFIRHYARWAQWLPHHAPLQQVRTQGSPQSGTQGGAHGTPEPLDAR